VLAPVPAPGECSGEGDHADDEKPVVLPVQSGKGRPSITTYEGRDPERPSRRAAAGGTGRRPSARRSR
jgi:hypothetical protein